jgi:3-hydroxyacyl-CoA dehydrogenase/enoyl-CoA hydratase/carnithine racemase
MNEQSVFKLQIENGIGVVSFDVVGDSMNTWTDNAWATFREVVTELKNDQTVKGAIFVSGKPDNFFAGANLRILEAMQTPEEVMSSLNASHNSFNLLKTLNIPTVAAIHGYCLGGGLEMTLVCTARIARYSKKTLIGLPETLVGLFPGAGGTQRLPRLIGYPAFDLILKGKNLTASEALEVGIIDRLIPEEGDLLAAAQLFLKDILAGKAELKRPQHDFSQVDIFAAQAKERILKTTRGRELPAHMQAIKAMRDGLKVSLEEGIEIEKKCFIDTIMSPQAKGSIHAFFLKTMTDKPKSMIAKDFVSKTLKKVGVLGFGMMGRGIVIDIICNMNIPIIVKDVPEALDAGKAFVKKILDGMAEKKRLKVPVDDLMKLVTTTSSYNAEFKNVDMVIEAVFEDIKVKEQVYKELCEFVEDDCIIVSNTSSLSINQMAPFVTHRSRFAGLHFFSPVWIMPLVEIVRGAETSEDTINNLLNYAASIKKRPVVCLDNPGFVVNAVLNPYTSSAYRYMEEGNAIEKIDRAALSFGFPVGPIRLTDEIGIDVVYKIFQARNESQKSLQKIVESGRFGLKKSGKGFFLKDGSVDPEVLPLIYKREANNLSEEEIQAGFLEGMVRVGKDLLDGNIVDNPRMIDIGMLWGTGFPADKGGPMKWADLTGLSRRLFGKNFY